MTLSTAEESSISLSAIPADDLRVLCDCGIRQLSHHFPEQRLSAATVSEQRHERWVHLYHQIQQLHAQHLGIAAIAQRVQVSRPTVYRYLAMSQPPERQRSRHRGQPLVSPCIPSLRRRWNAGCRNAQELWRELVSQGYQPSRRTVERYVGQLRQETGTRFKFRQVAPAPLYDENSPEGAPAPMTALRAARVFLSKPEDRRTILAQACMVIVHLTAGDEGRTMYLTHLAPPADGVCSQTVLDTMARLCPDVIAAVQGYVATWHARL